MHLWVDTAEQMPIRYAEPSAICRVSSILPQTFIALVLRLEDESLLKIGSKLKIGSNILHEHRIHGLNIGTDDDIYRVAGIEPERFRRKITWL
jgi:hypothetical protein